MIIRPEDIEPDEESKAMGKIISRRFYGYYYELGLSVLDEQVFIRTTDTSLKEGMIINLRLNAESIIPG